MTLSRVGQQCVALLDAFALVGGVLQVTCRQPFERMFWATSASRSGLTGRPSSSGSSGVAQVYLGGSVSEGVVSRSGPLVGPTTC
jgi:hypothetical protein